MSDISLLVLSCDKYSPCWKPFFTLLEKYYKGHPKAYLVCETKTCEYADTININSNCWSERFREALKQIDTKYVLVMLDDFFIRNPVDEERINRVVDMFGYNAIVYNFEQNYRKCEVCRNLEWDMQFNNQMYLNSCQPSIWDREKLIDRLQDNENAWSWEMKVIDSPYKHYINKGDLIIDIGNDHTLNWGIARGRLTEECKKFLASEGLYFEDNASF